MSMTSHFRQFYFRPLHSLLMVFALSVGVSTSNAIAQDSDGDGVTDSNDNCPTMANPDQNDCDLDGIGDACEIIVNRNTGNMGAFGINEIASGTLASCPHSISPVTITVEAIADLNLPTETATLTIGGVVLSTTLFQVGGHDCPATPDIAVLTMTATQWNAIVVGSAGANVLVSLKGNALVNSAQCSNPWALVSVRYGDAEGFCDCNDNGISDPVEIANGAVPDCNANSLPDSCDIASGFSFDCNQNSIPDSCDIADETSNDVEPNGVPDECKADCNGNSLPDAYEIAQGLVPDCNLNSIPDSCDIASGFSLDCNANNIPDSCDLATGFSLDCNANSIPDSCDIASGSSLDCNANGIPDSCDLASGFSLDCNANSIPDSCDIASGTSNDVEPNGVPDECKADCNGNSLPDAYEIAQGSVWDCNGNGIPDLCDVAAGIGADCNGNGRLDSCDIAAGESDKDFDGRPDVCEYNFGDFDLDGIVGGSDIGFLLGIWGETNPLIGDLDHDGVIGGGDLSIFLAHWGVAPYVSVTISSVSPAEGSTLGGTSISITGTDLDGATSVMIGGVAATSLNVNSPTNITAVTPAGTVGLADVVVLTGVGSATATNAFTYVVAPAWATLLEALPDATVVTDANLRAAIVASGFPWRIRDNSSNIEMLLVPAGTFTMGEEGWATPVHQVTLTNAFYMGRYEVTQAQWTAKMGSNPSYFSGFPDSPSRPVESVSWNMIASGSTSFMGVTGLRLPTEAEWEYAYRAGTTTAFHSYPGQPTGFNTDSLNVNIAWYSANANSQTHAVGGKFANALGLHDMSGNVWEWCQDWYGAYSSAAQTNPTGPATGSARLLRGGGCSFDSVSCRASERGGSAPGVHYYTDGFRVVRTP